MREAKTGGEAGYESLGFKRCPGGHQVPLSPQGTGSLSVYTCKCLCVYVWGVCVCVFICGHVCKQSPGYERREDKCVKKERKRKQERERGGKEARHTVCCFRGGKQNKALFRSRESIPLSGICADTRTIPEVPLHSSSSVMQNPEQRPRHRFPRCISGGGQQSHDVLTAQFLASSTHSTLFVQRFLHFTEICCHFFLFIKPNNTLDLTHSGSKL